MNALQTRVDGIIQEYAEEYESGVEGFMDDLNYGGCASGLISKLIYYHETSEFYEQYKSEISELLYEMMEQTGQSIDEMFGDKWDKSDPLATGDSNKQLLVWFAFEETASRLVYGE